jgi:LemA protein
MGMAGMVVLIVVAALLGVGLIGYVISVFNSLVQVRNNIEKAWKNIDVLLLQRHDELPKLVDTCIAYVKHEREVLTSLTELRTGYDKATTTDQKVRIENEINKRMSQLAPVWEGYPDLKASQNFLQIQQRISALESSIVDRRELFNDSVNIYNIQIERFPELLVAKGLGYRRHAFLEVPEEKRQDAKMKFG